MVFPRSSSWVLFVKVSNGIGDRSASSLVILGVRQGHISNQYHTLDDNPEPIWCLQIFGIFFFSVLFLGTLNFASFRGDMNSLDVVAYQSPQEVSTWGPVTNHYSEQTNMMHK
jgi:hypothetical protein